MAEATVRDVLTAKGSAVASIDPSATITDALGALAEHGVGALVVSSDGRRLEGILSERDIVRSLAAAGPGTLDVAVDAIMTTEVESCGFDERMSVLMARMTAGRFRHLPVLEADELAGVISIGDVVKHRLGELEAEAQQLLDFIQAR